MRVIGWPPRTCHRRVAVAEDGLRWRGLHKGCRVYVSLHICMYLYIYIYIYIYVHYIYIYTCGELGRAVGRHHRHSVRHTTFSVDGRTEQRGAGH